MPLLANHPNVPFNYSKEGIAIERSNSFMGIRS